MVDLATDDTSASAVVLAAAEQALGRLPCPSVALGAEFASPTGVALAEHFDVVVAEPAELEPVLTTIRRNPLAAAALVQLLRHSAGRGVHEGLIAESLVYSVLQAGPEVAAWLAARPPPEPRAAPFGPAVRVERNGARLDLTLDRPSRHNAFSAEMRDALVEALRMVSGDASIEEVVVRGAGPSFSSGGDLEEFGTRPDPATAHAIRSARNAARLLADCADRVRFEVHGACIGAGVELPAFAARVVARKDAFFQLPEVGMGLVPGSGGTVSIPRRIGRQRTAQFALSGQRVDAETARSWGLVDDLRA